MEQKNSRLAAELVQEVSSLHSQTKNFNSESSQEWLNYLKEVEKLGEKPEQESNIIQ